MSTLLGQVTWSAGYKLGVYYDVLSRDDVANTTTVVFSLDFTCGSPHGVHLSNLACKRRVGDTVYGGFVSIDQPASSSRTIDTWESTINNGVGTLVRVYLPLNAYFNGTYFESVTTADAYVQFDFNPYTVFGTVYNGTLGENHSFQVVKHTPGATHTITYRQGTESGTICTNSGDTTINWTPPLSLATLSPGGTSVTITLQIRTFLDGSGSGGSTGYTGYLANVTFSIPANVKPSVSIAVSDGNAYAATFGNYLHNKSTYAVAVTATPAYGSAIVSYSTVISGQTINGNAFNATYTGSTFTTDILQLVGTVTITTSVTDARGRVGTATRTVTAVQYTPPLITALSVHRCNADGTENDQGEYVAFTFSAAVQSLGSINMATYWYKYKSSAADSYTPVALPALANQYAVTDYMVIFQADSSYTYDIVVSVQDGVMTTERSVQASTAATILNLHNSGTGLAIGKVAEDENLFDIGLPTRFRESVIFDQPIDGFISDKQDKTNTLTTETTLADNDQFPFYDTSASDHRKTLWSNIKAKLKTYFDSLYAAVSHTHSYLPLSGGTVTGTIKCNDIKGTDSNNVVSTFDVNGNRHVQLGTASTYAYIPCSAGRIDVGSYSIQFETASGFTILGSSNETYCQLGKSTGRWRSLYAVNGTIQTSDKRRKQDVSYDLEKIKQVMSRVKPLSYRYNDIENDKTRYGFFAQDLESELNDNGLDAADIAGLTIDEIEPTEAIPDGKLYGISYEQFVPIAIGMIQDLQAEVAGLKSEIATMKE